MQVASESLRRHCHRRSDNIPDAVNTREELLGSHESWHRASWGTLHRTRKELHYGVPVPACIPVSVWQYTPLQGCADCGLDSLRRACGSTDTRTVFRNWPSDHRPTNQRFNQISYRGHTVALPRCEAIFLWFPFKRTFAFDTLDVKCSRFWVNFIRWPRESHTHRVTNFSTARRPGQVF